MNLRMTPNTLRFRVNKSELNQILAGQTICERLSLAPETVLEYQVSLANPADTQRVSGALQLNTTAAHGKTVLHLQVMPAIAQAYANADDQRKGIEDLMTQSNGEDLLLALEVDIGRH